MHSHLGRRHQPPPLPSADVPPVPPPPPPRTPAKPAPQTPTPPPPTPISALLVEKKEDPWMFLL